MKLMLLLTAALMVSGCAAKVGTVEVFGKKVMLTASLGCEAADLATSMYAFGQDQGAYEVNPLLAPAQHDPLRFTLRKVVLAAPTNVIGVWMFERGQPLWGGIILGSNAVVKCWIASRNDRLRIGNDQ